MSGEETLQDVPNANCYVAHRKSLIPVTLSSHPNILVAASTVMISRYTSWTGKPCSGSDWQIA